MANEYSADEPLLPNLADAENDKLSRSTFAAFFRWVLGIAMWLVFGFWVAVMFVSPLDSAGNKCLGNWTKVASGSIYGITGSIFLVFRGPVLVVAFLTIASLNIAREKELQLNKSSKHPRFRLQTFPVLVDGPFGVVSAAEFIGICLFVLFVSWVVYAYTMQILNLPSTSAGLDILQHSGLRLGSIVMYCWAFLFLPISRGSVLLSIIDVPFEQATWYHVWLGHLTMFFFTLHGLCYIITWAVQGVLLDKILEWMDDGVANLAGVITFLAGLLMWVTAMPPVRKKQFELFFYTHQLYVVFVIFLALHIGDFIISMAAGGIFLFVIDRFLRFCQSRRTVDIISVTCLPCGTVELVFSKPANLRYNALSFIFLQIRELSWLQCYENLILVAGGSGISPFLAILSDILHLRKQGKPCLPRNVFVIWAIKRSEKLHLLSTLDMELICPNLPDRLNLEVCAYVTRESDPPLEEGSNNEGIGYSASHLSRGRGMSALVGTGNRLWSGLYVISSAVGFAVLMALLDIFYINPLNIVTWWYRGLLPVGCMLASVIIFGGPVIYLWHRWEQRTLSVEEAGDEEDDKSQQSESAHANVMRDNFIPEDRSVSRSIHCGARPNFEEIFKSVSERWGNVDVGVIECGPATLQSSVAKQCRSQNLRRGSLGPIEHR